jgi:hypothetical protein
MAAECPRCQDHVIIIGENVLHPGKVSSPICLCCSKLQAQNSTQMIRFKVTFGTWLFFLLGKTVCSTAAFTPKPHALLTIRGGSDFTPEGDGDSPTFETTVIQEMSDTPNDKETPMVNVESAPVGKASNAVSDCGEERDEPFLD